MVRGWGEVEWGGVGWGGGGISGEGVEWVSGLPRVCFRKLDTHQRAGCMQRTASKEGGRGVGWEGGGGRWGDVNINQHGSSCSTQPDKAHFSGKRVDRRRVLAECAAVGIAGQTCVPCTQHMFGMAGPRPRMRVHLCI